MYSSVKSRIARLGWGLILMASLAVAGDGRFKLPFEAHFESVTLSPGEYRVSTPAGIPVIYLYGNGKVRATLASTVEPTAEPGHSYLELVNVGGTYFVQKYNAGTAGKTFTFAIPKAIRRQIIADTRAISLPVTGQ